LVYVTDIKSAKEQIITFCSAGNYLQKASNKKKKTLNVAV